jgi:hypothetical protein
MPRAIPPVESAGRDRSSPDRPGASQGVPTGQTGEATGPVGRRADWRGDRDVRVDVLASPKRSDPDAHGFSVDAPTDFASPETLQGPQCANGSAGKTGS